MPSEVDLSMLTRLTSGANFIYLSHRDVPNDLGPWPGVGDCHMLSGSETGLSSSVFLDRHCYVSA